MLLRGLALLLVALPQAKPAGPPTVFVVDSLTRVRPKDAPGPMKEARIHAARNEYESFQVVVGSPEGGL